MTQKFSDLTEENLNSYDGMVITKMLQDELKSLAIAKAESYSPRQTSYISLLEEALVTLYDKTQPPPNWLDDYHSLIIKIRSKS